MASKDKIVVAIDFGTTFSAVAFSYGNPDNIEVIKTWPGSKRLTSDKVPTEFTYDMKSSLGKRKRDSDHSATLINTINPCTSGSDAIKPIRMGYELSPDECRVKCIKLFLERHAALPDFVDALHYMKDLRVNGRSVHAAVADFLARLRDHAIDHLRKRYGDSFVTSTAVQYILTVPAIWSDAAKHATLRAAKQAGMGSHCQLLSEPEAAAVHALKAIQPNSLKTGDNIVVCDAGGGTVDLISYTIASTEPMSLKECAVGTGGLCGAAFLNTRFESYIRDLLGEEEFDNMRLKMPKTWQSALNMFEDYVKRNFDGDVDTDFNIPFPGLADNDEVGIELGFLSLTSKQVEEIFLPVVGKVIRLVQEQVANINAKNEVVKAILLVGGFGQSSYLFSRLKSSFGSYYMLPDRQQRNTSSYFGHCAQIRNHQQSIQVLQPIDAWTAVVRGAVLRGLEGSIVSERYSRFHYGTVSADIYDAAKHTQDQCYFDELDELHRARDCMTWYVSKGELVSAKRAISFWFVTKQCRKDFLNNRKRTSSHTLYASTNELAPTRYNQQMLLVCKLVVNHSGIPKKAYEKRNNSKGRSFYRLNFELEMKLDSATLAFGMKVDGKTCGSVEVAFDHEMT